MKWTFRSLSGELALEEDLHAGDVLEIVLDAPAHVLRTCPVEGQQRENRSTAVARLVAVDLAGRAGTGSRTVQQGAQAAVEKTDQQKENFPADPHSPIQGNCSENIRTGITYLLHFPPLLVC